MYTVRVDSSTIRNHFQYDWWRYAIGIVATIFLWSMVTAMARPQTPPEKRVDIFLVGAFAIDEELTELSRQILADFPELLEINFTNIVLEGDPQLELAGRQKLMVMLGSQTGDIFVFNREEYKVLAGQGAFIALDEVMGDYINELILPEEIDDYRVMIESADGVQSEPMIYGLPLRNTEAFEDSMFNVEDKVISVMAYTRNEANAIGVLRWLLSVQ